MECVCELNFFLTQHLCFLRKKILRDRSVWSVYLFIDKRGLYALDKLTNKKAGGEGERDRSTRRTLGEPRGERERERDRERDLLRPEPHTKNHKQLNNLF